MVPDMTVGCSVQTYRTSPGRCGVKMNVAPGWIVAESNVVVLRPAASASLVTVWPTLSLLSHSIRSPVLTVIVDGENARLRMATWTTGPLEGGGTAGRLAVDATVVVLDGPDLRPLSAIAV